MLLSSKDIRANISSGNIEITPAPRIGDWREFGVRVYLGDDLLVPIPGEVHLNGTGSDPEYEKFSLRRNGSFTLRPGSFVLGCTKEKFKLDRTIVGMLDGRSSVARLGVMVHAGSQIIDGVADEARSVTLEIANFGVHTVVINAGDPIGMMAFARSQSAAGRHAHGQYMNQRGPMPPTMLLGGR